MQSKAYPYGNTYQASCCNGYDYWGRSSTTKALPVGSLSSCQSSVPGYAGVYDLSGNVWEWEDSCRGNEDPPDDCFLQGGSFAFGASYLACDNFFSGYRTDAGDNIGFRCCSA